MCVHMPLARGTGRRNNARFAGFGLRAMNTIQPSREIFVGYGPEFKIA
eukprot:SAG31_NODE_2593_length_5423_cov_21.402705_3_plen_48_part_00